jgi:Domain of unknown function DUF29
MRAECGDSNVARAKQRIEADAGLYERDFSQWVEEQVALLEGGVFERLDLENLIEEIRDMARRQKKAIRNDLIVVLTHLLKWQHQPEQRSPSWTGSIVGHRRRIRDEIEESPSLAGYPGEVFERCYRSAREQAVADTALPAETFPAEPAFSLEQPLDPKFLPA